MMPHGHMAQADKERAKKKKKEARKKRVLELAKAGDAWSEFDERSEACAAAARIHPAAPALATPTVLSGVSDSPCCGLPPARPWG